MTGPQPLGVILGGGRSLRFGSDKALASIAGLAMLDIVAGRLAPQCAEIAVAGRDWPGLTRIDDRPENRLGPLGGLAGALAYAVRRGHSAVLTSGCDIPGLPLGLLDLLGEPDAILAKQPTVGHWRSDRADQLCEWLLRTERRSIRAWADAIGARRTAGPDLVNVNRPADLERISPPLAGPRSSR